MIHAPALADPGHGRGYGPGDLRRGHVGHRQKPAGRRHLEYHPVDAGGGGAGRRRYVRGGHRALHRRKGPAPHPVPSRRRTGALWKVGTSAGKRDEKSFGSILLFCENTL